MTLYVVKLELETTAESEQEAEDKVIDNLGDADNYPDINHIWPLWASALE